MFSVHYACKWRAGVMTISRKKNWKKNVENLKIHGDVLAGGLEMNPSSIIIVLLWEMKVKLSTSNRFEANFTWEKRRKTECPAFYSSSLPLSFILFYLKSKWRCLSKTGKKQQFNCRVHTYKAKDFLIDKYGGKFPCFSEIRVIESSSDQKIAIWFALLQ